MAHALVFHSAADREGLGTVMAGLEGLSVLSIPGPVPAGVHFGSRVVVVWSRHAAAEFEAGSAGASLPRNSVILQLDDTPLPVALASGARAIAIVGDGADAARLKAALTNDPLARAVVTSGRPRRGPARRLATPSDRARGQAPRPEKLTRFKAATQRRTQTAFMVLSASAFGTLTAWGLGSTVPAEVIVTPSFANVFQAGAFDAGLVRYEHAARTRGLEASAAFQGATSPDAGSIVFSADEVQTLTEKLDQAELAMIGIRFWSDGVINRLQGLAERTPEAMPAMAPGPVSPSAPATSTASASDPSLSQATPALELVALRDRFAQVEPMVHAVDRVSALASAAPTASRDRGG
jgi:hypothetical protein